MLQHLVKHFFNCSKLTGIIPSDLFIDKSEVLTLYQTFQNCVNISSIAEGCFDSMTKLNNCQSTFNGCTSLTSIPETLFNNNKEITNFTTMFQGCTSLTGNTPTTDGLQLWERAGQTGYPSSIYGTQCFYRATRLTNYSSIPTGWK